MNISFVPKSMDLLALNNTFHISKIPCRCLNRKLFDERVVQRFLMSWCLFFINIFELFLESVLQIYVETLMSPFCFVISVVKKEI